MSLGFSVSFFLMEIAAITTKGSETAIQSTAHMGESIPSAMCIASALPLITRVIKGKSERAKPLCTRFCRRKSQLG